MALWSKIIRNYFTFNKRERRGLYVLLAVLTVLTAVHALLRFTPESALEFSQGQLQRVREFKRTIAQQEERESKRPPKLDLTKVLWHAFDPNSASFGELAELGLDSTLAHRIENYRSKGGRFYDADDVARIYGMPTAWVEAAEPHMRFPNRKKERRPPYDWKQREKEKFRKPTREINRVELNTADSTALVQLPWVGAFYASEIVALRMRLGGFRSYDQLLDIYRMKDETMESLLEHTTLDTALMPRININTCSVEDLGRHPYLTWREARTIINYRQQHGPFQSVSDLVKTRVVNDSLCAKIAPYLRVE